MVIIDIRWEPSIRGSMKISGFTFLRNASKLYYPIKESILSLLPLVDEFVIALGDCDQEDGTEDLLASIESDKIRLVRTVWDTMKYPRNSEYAHQTDIAKRECTGDWLFYLQGDEVIHEKDYPVIRAACERFLEDDGVEGFVFDYFHFWGDYEHHNNTHAMYPKEIRIVRNLDAIHSWKDAQSFRYLPKFKEEWTSYFDKTNTRKLNVVQLPAHIYHYGGVRPPDYMARKNRSFFTSYYSDDQQRVAKRDFGELFDYGPLDRMQLFHGSHPKIMRERIADFDWGHMLQYSGKPREGRPLHKHEKLKSKILTFVEQRLLGGGIRIGGFHNYRITKRY